MSKKYAQIIITKPINKTKPNQTLFHTSPTSAYCFNLVQSNPICVSPTWSYLLCILLSN